MRRASFKGAELPRVGCPAGLKLERNRPRVSTSPRHQRAAKPLPGRSAGVSASGPRRDQAALRHLRGCDRRLAAIIQRVGPFAPDIVHDPFVALVASIVHQQVSMAAAATIFQRVKALCPRRRLSPAALLAIKDEALRGAGLSRQKLTYIRDLSAHFATRKLQRVKLRRMSDDEVISAVTAVKGIGRWTAEMLLIFSLERSDVWPVDDLGLQRAAQRFVGADQPLSSAAIRELAEPWRPYRSYATWYLWRSLETPGAGAISQ